MDYFSIIGKIVPAEKLVMDCEIQEVQGKRVTLILEAAGFDCLHSSCDAAEFEYHEFALHYSASVGADCTLLNSAYHLRLDAGMFVFVVTAALFL